MTFATGLLNDIQVVGAGEQQGLANTILSFETFEDGLTVGRFAKLDTGSIDNLDASATPVIAGIVLRDVAGALEAGSTLETDINSHVELGRSGLFTVDVKTGDTPVAFGSVFAHNVADADIGKASTADDANTEPTGAEFIQAITATVWLVRLV